MLDSDYFRHQKYYITIILKSLPSGILLTIHLSFLLFMSGKYTKIFRFCMFERKKNIRFICYIRSFYLKTLLVLAKQTTFLKQPKKSPLAAVHIILPLPRVQSSLCLQSSSLVGICAIVSFPPLLSTPPPQPHWPLSLPSAWMLALCPLLLSTPPT